MYGGFVCLITLIDMQVPGSTTYTLALYYMMDTPLEKVPLLEAFVNGDDTFRNSRFKLIPYISKVPIFSYKSIFVLNRKTRWFMIGNSEYVISGILDCEAECGQESLFDWSSTRNQLLPWKQLSGGTSYAWH
jgi:hypothetical protein